MGQQPYGIRPRSVGEILSQTASIYRDHFGTLVGIGAVILVPMGIIQLLLGLVIENSDDLMANFLLSLFSTIFQVGASAAVFAAVTAATAQIVLHGRTTVLNAFDYSSAHIIPTIRATFLVLAILVALVVFIVTIPVAIFFAIAWAVTIQAVVLENVGARAGLGRSWELTRGNRLRVLGSALGVICITGLMVLFFELPGLAISLRSLIREDPGSVPLFASLLTTIFALAGTVLITPLQFCAWTLMYLDLRARNDGLTTEPVAPQAFDAAPASLPNMD